jgi:protein phosphatase
MAPQQDLIASGFGLSHVGRIRKRNEDSMHIDPQGRFAMVADGMGGHFGGQEASRMTCDHIRSALESQYETLFLWEEPDIHQFLKSTFQRVSAEVFETGTRDPSLEHMGTTLVTWLLQKNRIYVAHVGDSRAYLIRDNMIFQTTMDHTFVNEQINLGSLRSQLPPFTLPHAIFRNIGMTPPSEPSIMTAEARVGDIWLLCTDGLSGKIPPEEILAIITKKEGTDGSHASLAEICKTLVQSAIEYGGEDNVTALLLQVHAAEPT